MTALAAERPTSAPVVLGGSLSSSGVRLLLPPSFPAWFRGRSTGVRAPVSGWSPILPMAYEADALADQLAAARVLLVDGGQ